MTTETYRGVMLDDKREDLTRYSQGLSDRGPVKFRGILYEGQGGAIEDLERDKPDLILVDYSLAEGATLAAGMPCFGSTLAALLREKLPECPIVLITRGSIFNTSDFAKAFDVQGTFDDTVLKEELGERPEFHEQSFVELIRGFRALQEQDPGDWSALCAILGATEEESDLLIQSQPPRQHGASGGWRVTEAARWIRKTVLEYPGILYPPLYAASMLGISEVSFLEPTIQEHFSSAKYVGPFQPVEGRWWKDRLMVLAYDVFHAAGVSTACLHEFARAWKKHRGADLQLSTGVSSEKQPAECVCHVLGKPVRRECSLPYWPDNRPAVMDEARVSFKAIRESNDFHEEYVAPDARGLVKEIQDTAAGR